GAAEDRDVLAELDDRPPQRPDVPERAIERVRRRVAAADDELQYLVHSSVSVSVSGVCTSAKRGSRRFRGYASRRSLSLARSAASDRSAKRSAAPAATPCIVRRSARTS